MTKQNFPRHYGDELPLYVAGHVSSEEGAAIDRHLAECIRCRSECDLWRSLPGTLASLDSVPTPSLSIDEIWGKLAPRLQDNSTVNGRPTSMSFISDTPPRPPSPSRTTRTLRPNTWAAVAVVLVVIVLMGGFFAVLKSRNTSPSVGGTPPTATATSTPALTATSTPPAPTATAVAGVGGNVSGTWTGNGSSYTDANQQACYTLVLTQARGSTTVTGKFGVFFGTPCGSPYYFSLSGSMHGAQLNATAATVAPQMKVLAMSASPLNPASSCGPTTLTLTHSAPTTLTGTITNCITVNITFTRH